MSYCVPGATETQTPGNCPTDLPFLCGRHEQAAGALFLGTCGAVRRESVRCALRSAAEIAACKTTCTLPRLPALHPNTARPAYECIVLDVHVHVCVRHCSQHCSSETSVAQNELARRVAAGRSGAAVSFVGRVPLRSARPRPEAQADPPVRGTYYTCQLKRRAGTS